MSSNEIHPYRFYSTKETKRFLHGKIKIETLRKFGLRGLGEGYWGSNIIDAISRFCANMPLERDPAFQEERGQHGTIFEKRATESSGLSNGRLQGSTTEAQLDGRGNQLGDKRQAVLSSRNWPGEVESQLDVFEREKKARGGKCKDG